MLETTLKKVMVFGTFDKFHPGHINFLKQAEQYGDYLIVVVARDITVKKLKGKAPKFSEKERQKEIIKSALADEVVLGKFKNKYKLIKYFRPDVICLGYDQKYLVDGLSGQLKKFGIKNVKIIRLKAYYPEKYKSSLI
ncbi:MAG: adenylyltransferase/cytidyltransferase family protein [Xanthomonadaceae bacterium]|nr:adenylyltransferase/cytidyltransferase family protein [Rhodospirillaceae bacterium]NIA17622.1 adenylyltransferase/cytidyltransferase family protein [Xanthomonadaceae bacterium]